MNKRDMREIASTITGKHQENRRDRRAKVQQIFSASKNLESFPNFWHYRGKERKPQVRQVGSMNSLESRATVVTGGGRYVNG